MSSKQETGPSEPNSATNCPICGKQLDQSKPLPCGHGFCPDCAAKPQANHKVMCLVCDEEHIVAVADLKPLYGLKEFFEHLRKMQAYKCGNHPEIPVLFYCDTCNVEICKECWRADHNDGATHDISYLEAVQNKQLSEKIENFDMDKRLAEINLHIELCDKATAQLDHLFNKLQEERMMLEVETEMIDRLNATYPKLQQMANGTTFDVFDPDVARFMAVTETPYEARSAIIKKEDKANLEALIEEMRGLVTIKSPETSICLD